MPTFRLEDNVLMVDRHQEVNCVHCDRPFYGRFRLIYDFSKDAEKIFDMLREAEYTCENCLTLMKFQDK